MNSPTIGSYDQNALRYASESTARGAREIYVDRLLDLISKVHPKVVEIGCANGREAKLFLQKGCDYTGFDGSSELVKLAQQAIPEGVFFTKTFSEMILPDHIDLIVAFASLLHASSEEIVKLLKMATESLNVGGIFFFDFQVGNDEIEQRVDDMGTRVFYKHNPKTIKTLIPKGLTILEETKKTLRDKVWFEMTLKKV